MGRKPGYTAGVSRKTLGAVDEKHRMAVLCPRSQKWDRGSKPCSSTPPAESCGMPDIKPYTHVRLIPHEPEHGLMQRFEIRTSIFIEFDDNHGRRAVNRKPTREEALERAKEIAQAERERTGG